jgi:hypothetical protein
MSLKIRHLGAVKAASTGDPRLIIGTSNYL